MEQNPILTNQLSLNSDIPLYSQLVGIIKRSISSGTLNVGDLLPSEAELCRALDVSRNTVRQAIGELEEEGLVVRKRGKDVYKRQVESGWLYSDSAKYRAESWYSGTVYERQCYHRHDNIPPGRCA